MFRLLLLLYVSHATPGSHFFHRPPPFTFSAQLFNHFILRQEATRLPASFKTEQKRGGWYRNSKFIWYTLTASHVRFYPFLPFFSTPYVSSIQRFYFGEYYDCVCFISINLNPHRRVHFCLMAGRQTQTTSKSRVADGREASISPLKNCLSYRKTV